MKVAMRLDDNRIHFPIHQRDAARISIEMTELTPMKGNSLQFVTNVNLSRVTLSVCASFTSSLHPWAHNHQSLQRKMSMDAILKTLTRRRANEIQRRRYILSMSIQYII